MTQGRNRFVKYLAYSLELLVLYVVQSAAGLMPPIFSQRPLLVLVAVITIALLEDEVPAIFFGFAGGFLMDLGFGNYFGLFAMIMAIICCMVRLSARKKLNVTVLSCTGIGAVFAAVTIGLDWLIRYVWAGYSSPLISLVDGYIPRYFYTVLMLPLLYLVNLGIYTGLRPVEAEE